MNRFRACWVGLLALAFFSFLPVQGQEENKEFNRLHRRGNEHYNKGDYASAAQAYRQALTLSKTADLFFNLGNALYRQGQKKEAVDAFREALKLKPAMDRARINLGMVLFEMNDPKATLEALADAPPKTAVWRVRASCFERLGDLSAKLFALRQCAQGHPDDVNLRLETGDALYRLKRFEEALEEFKTVLRLAPARAEAHRYLGWTLVGLKRNDEALAALELALRLLPKPDLGTLSLVADLYVRQGLYREAADHYARARRSRKPSPRELLRDGSLYWKAGDPDRARAVLKAALKDDSNLHAAALALGEIFLSTGSLEEAEKAFARARESSSTATKAKALLGLGELHLSKGELEKSLASFEQAGRLDPLDPLARVGQGRVHLRNRRYDLAAKAFDDALAVDPANRTASRLLALVREKAE